MISLGLLGPPRWDAETGAALAGAKSLSGPTLAQGVQAEIRGGVGTYEGDSRFLLSCQPVGSSRGEWRGPQHENNNKHRARGAASAGLGEGRRKRTGGGGPPLRAWHRARLDLLQ